MKTHIRALVCAFPLGLLLWSPYAHAMDTFTVTRMPDGSSQVSQPLYRALRAGGFDPFGVVSAEAGGSVRTAMAVTVPVGERSAAMTVGKIFTKAQVGTLLAKGLPMVGTVAVAYDVAKAIRCYAQPGATGWGGLLECDEGTPQTMQTTYSSTTFSAPFCQAMATANDVYLCELDHQRVLWAASNPTYTWYPLTQAAAIAIGAPAGTAGVTKYACAKVGIAPAAWTSCTLRTTFGSGATPSSGLLCPSSIGTVPGDFVPAGQPVGPDGLCPTARYASPTRWLPATVATVVDKYVAAPDGTARPDAVVTSIRDLAPDALAGYADEPNGTPSLRGPASVTGPSSTVTPPGGTPQTTTTYYNITYNINTFNYTTTTTAPDGTAKTETPPKEIEVCGLPGKPACKIDESGTPSTGSYAEAQAVVEAAKATRQTQIEDSAKKTTLGWSWPLSIPASACSIITLYTPPSAPAFTVDLCSSSAVAIFRALLAWLVASWTVLYVWRSVTGLEQG